MIGDQQIAATDLIHAAPARRRPWTQWLVPRPFDWVATFLYLAVLALFAVRQTVAAGGAVPLLPVIGMALAIATLIGLDRWEWERFHTAAPASVAAWLFAARVVLIEIVVQIEGFGLSVFLYTLIPFAAALTWSSRAGWLSSALVWLVFSAKLVWFKPYWYQSPEQITNAIVFTMALIFMQAMARLVTEERRERARSEALLADLERSHAQLTRYADQVGELATTAERNRIARDIHDSLGHYLTVINVQLEKALAFRAKNAPEADRAVRDSKHLAHEALGDVRRSVGLLRRGDQPFALRDALQTLVAQQTDQIAITLKLNGDDSRLSHAAQLALFRGVQEGLTNVRKHAQAQHVSISLNVSDTDARLSITDDGVGFDRSDQIDSDDGRYGLRGLAERLDLIHGRMEITSQPGAGTTLTLIVPVERRA